MRPKPLVAVLLKLLIVQNLFATLYSFGPSLASNTIRRTSTSRLFFWFCDENDCIPEDNGGADKIRKELEDMERARSSFEELIHTQPNEQEILQPQSPQHYYPYHFHQRLPTSKGNFYTIQDEGIVLTDYDYPERGNEMLSTSTMPDKQTQKWSPTNSNPVSIRTSSSSSSSSSKKAHKAFSYGPQSTNYTDDEHHTTPRSSIHDKHVTDKLLTSSGRLIREAEIRLLESLVDNDSAAEALIQFWTTERDSFAGNDLLVMSSQHTELSENLHKEQVMLEAMIEAYPNWAEPHSRLASLRFFRGHYGLAEQSALKVLELKPWHFEVMQLLVSIYLKTGNDKDAMVWARRALPPITDLQRRAVWCQSAVEEAQRRIDEDEKYTNHYYYNQRRLADYANRKLLHPDQIWQ
jgi:hypothetical protein